MVCHTAYYKHILLTNQQGAGNLSWLRDCTQRLGQNHFRISGKTLTSRTALQSALHLHTRVGALRVDDIQIALQSQVWYTLVCVVNTGRA